MFLLLAILSQWYSTVHFFWYLVVMVSTSFGRNCSQRKCQDLFDDLKSLFTNVLSDKRASFSLVS